MMQFTGTKTETTTAAAAAAQLHLPPYDVVGVCFSSGSSCSLPGIQKGSSNHMEQLLVHCANAIETNDATLAQQILWILNNIAPADGDSNQRLTSAFLRSLLCRASRSDGCKLLTAVAAHAIEEISMVKSHRFSAVALASFIDLTPWHRFGYTAANAAIVEAVEGFSVVHIVDLTTTHCMQMPTLIEALANRPEGPPPILRLTVPLLTSTNPPPPLLDISYDELGSRLINFARSRNILMEFKAVPSDPSDAFDSLIEYVRLHQFVSDGPEALVVNCQMLLHTIPEETAGTVPQMISSSSSTTTSTAAAATITTTPALTSPPFISLRTMFLKSIRSLEPVIVTLIDEDADLVSNDLIARVRSAFNYLWIPYDAVDAFLPQGSEKRQWYESDVFWKVENVIARERLQRVERQEIRSKWVQRMTGAGFRRISFGEEAVTVVKALLDEHAAGWGLKKEEDDLVLTWKGHNVIFATSWLPQLNIPPPTILQ